MDNDTEQKPRMSLKDALETASRQVAESPEWLRDIYKRNDSLLEQQRRNQRGETDPTK